MPNKKANHVVNVFFTLSRFLLLLEPARKRVRCTTHQWVCEKLKRIIAVVTGTATMRKWTSSLRFMSHIVLLLGLGIYTLTIVGKRPHCGLILGPQYSWCI